MISSRVKVTSGSFPFNVRAPLLGVIALLPRDSGFFIFSPGLWLCGPCAFLYMVFMYPLTVEFETIGNRRGMSLVECCASFADYMGVEVARRL
jgi:hypothetical protein